MKRYQLFSGFILLLIILGSSNSQGQLQTRIDSLEKELNNPEKNDEKKSGILLELTREYLYVSLDTALMYGTQALEFSEQAGNTRNKIIALRYIGINYLYRNEYSSAIEYYDSSLVLAIEAEYKEGEASCLFNIGNVYEHLGDFEKALDYYLQSIKIMEETEDRQGYAYILNGIGYIHKNQRNYDMALEYFQEALEVNREIGLQNEIAYTLHGIGSIYLILNDLETALEFHLQSLDIRKSINDKNGMSVSLEEIGKIYVRTENFNQAIQYFTEALELAEENETRWTIISNKTHLGSIYTKLKIYSTAKNYLDDALESALETESKGLLMDCYSSLADYYSDRKEYEQSLAYYKLYSSVKDSMFQDESSKQIAEMQAKYETGRKDSEIQLQRVEIEKNEAEIKKQNIQRNALMGGVLLFVVLMMVVYRSYRQKKKANILLTKQNTEINQQKEEIETQRDNLESLNQQLITQKEKLQNALQDLKETQSQLVESERMASLGQLTAGIAHELNNPVNFISGNVKPLKRDVEDILKILSGFQQIVNNKNLQEEFAEIEALKEELDLSYLEEEIFKLLEGMDAGARRSGQIVKGLRNFSRLDNDKFIFADIHEGIDAALTLLENTTKDKISIKKQFGEIPQIECLPAKINQVFLNILTNSIQAIEEMGEINIITTLSEDYVSVTIKDSGRGMEADVIQHIFEPFYTTHAVGEGTGLGLSISYGIIEQHQGKIEVQSQPGKGAEFTIKLPIRK